ncbi:MAG: phosphonate metabolism transcriptional regulator PhnF [Marinosulfonomonas sp.]
MPKVPVWKTIADHIRRDIAKGHYKPGEKLPTEAAFATRFDVNRHTIRHAISALAEEDVVYSRRGSGVFVSQESAQYALGKRVRFHQNLGHFGSDAVKQVLELGTRSADAKECKSLGLKKGSLVHVYKGLGVIKNKPVAHFISVFPAARFENLIADITQDPSVTRALKRAGVQDFTRASTRLTAVLADTITARLLMINPGAALIRSIGVNVDEDGTPVELGTTWFAGDKVELTLDE